VRDVEGSVDFSLASLARRIMHTRTRNMRAKLTREDAKWRRFLGRRTEEANGPEGVETVEGTGLVGRALSFSRWGLFVGGSWACAVCGNSRNWLFCHESFEASGVRRMSVLLKRRSICKKR
jgi:hypothetical protein